MPTNYSVDLRWRAVWLYLIRRMSYAEIADVLFMSQRPVALYQSSSDVEPRKQRHGPKQLLSEFEQITVLQSMIDTPGIYLTELQQKFNDATGKWIHL